jgi:hypothetical protein
MLLNMQAFWEKEALERIELEQGTTLNRKMLLF